MNNEKKYLRLLIEAVEAHIKNLDHIMKMPSSEQRGAMVSRSVNILEIQKDIAKRFGKNPTTKRKVKTESDAT